MAKPQAFLYKEEPEFLFSLCNIKRSRLSIDSQATGNHEKLPTFSIENAYSDPAERFSQHALNLSSLAGSPRAIIFPEPHQYLVLETWSIWGIWGYPRETWEASRIIFPIARRIPATLSVLANIQTEADYTWRLLATTA